MSPQTLNELPNEILGSIFRNFCQHCRSESEPDTPHGYIRGTRQRPEDPSWYSLDCQALHSLCLTSKHIRDIAQPILYHDFMPGYGDSWRSESYAWGERLVYFLRTIIQRPDLAALVRRIYIHPLLVKNIDETWTKNTLEPVTQGLAFPLSEYLAHFPNEGGFESDFYQHQMLFAPLFGILLAVLTNLSHLSLQVAPRSVPISPSALEVAGVSKLCLKNIDISAYSNPRSNGDYKFNIGNDTYGLFELVDNIETLNLHMCYSVPNPLRVKMRALHITHSRMNEESLGNLLSYWTGLETFIYEATHPPLITYGCLSGSPMDDGIVHFQPNDAIGYLYDHRSTLKTLHLDLRNWSIVGKLPQPISILREFTALEDLLLNQDMICNDRRTEQHQITGILPPSIRKLQIIGPFREFFHSLVKGLHGLADAASQGDFPHLRRVMCDMVNDLEGYGLGESFARARVDFSYEAYLPSGPTILPSHIVTSPRHSEFLPVLLPEEDGL
ncbi:hypothetical protein K445DRAFT_322307 [Daldinia sp. EC12]|nr:hypothetical protein K445DRAFT_322307 [Daldinia sp. EC12]